VPARNVPSDWETIAARFGARVRARREELGLTQEELAHRAGISRNQIQNIEHSRNNARDDSGRRVGGVGNPRLDTVWAISVALEIDVAELVRPPR
jgi:transcriptional regulator with XRE-family HTH domain